jgi:hypothetical protein
VPVNAQAEIYALAIWNSGNHVLEHALGSLHTRLSAWKDLRHRSGDVEDDFQVDGLRGGWLP